jgi:hypothetical protein
MFHVTSTHNRDSIREHGLDWTRMQDQPGIAGDTEPERAGVFLARDVEEAEWFVRLGGSHHRSMDIWEATVPEDFDPWDEDRPPPGYDMMDGHLYTTRRIPPDRVRLFRKDCVSDWS